ncbi:hypothetical protein KSF_109180 [Reticulibacter mediterranei]|uniref:Uncharacterized protein n=1 Tax=Reticulibacter mediterranei TaxID=2778369 RepID=A0A8J3N9R3_9CHLR|nr:hypothetical protein KSF_109180 [Reticulibacter mediterranei]
MLTASVKIPLQEANSPLPGTEGNSAVPTLNVITYSQESVENENVTREENSLREQQGNSLAEAVEGHTANRKAYVHYLSENDKRTILAAFIYTQQQIQSRQYSRRPINTPGAYFDTMMKAWGATKYVTYETACAAYRDAYDAQRGGRQKLPGIPFDIQELVRRFWGWSYQDIAVELQIHPLPTQVKDEHGTAPASTLWTNQPDALEPRVPHRWMDQKEEALALIERIRCEAPTVPGLSYQISQEPRAYRIRGTERMVYLVDVVIENVPDVYAEAAQWQEYYESVRE